MVLHFTKHGWNENPKHGIRPHHNKILELSVENYIILWDSRVDIPTSLQQILLTDLHAEHSGMVKMKQMTRGYLWWPNIDKDIENTVKSCVMCQENAKAPIGSQPASWSWPVGPWKLLNLDLPGHFMGKMFFVLVGAHSTYLETIPLMTVRPRSHLPRRPWGLQNLRPLAIIRRPQYFHGHTM